MHSTPETPLESILFLLPHLRPGGIERGTVLLANALHARGEAVRLVVGTRDGALIGLLDPGVALDDLGGRRAAASLAALRRRMTGARVVYSGTNARNVQLLATAALMRNAPPVIISEHTSAAEYLARAKAPALRRRLLRRFYPRADLLVAPTPGLGESWLAELGLDRPPVRVLPNPVLSDEDIELSAEIAAGHGAARDPDRIVAIGRLHPAKGHDRLVAALALARKTRPELTLAIYGEGEARPALQAQIDALGLGDAVDLAGLTDRPLRAIAGAGLFALASHREGFGNVVIEAFAAGTPVLTTDTEGPRQLLAGLGPAGRIVGQGDIGALARGMVEMTGDGAALAAAKGPARLRALDYSVRSAAEAFLSMVDDLTLGQGRRRA